MPAEKWRHAKREVQAVLIARARHIIAYIELVGQVTAIQLEPQSLALRPCVLHQQQWCAELPPQRPATQPGDEYLFQ